MTRADAVSLRPAVPGDRELLLRLYATTREAEMAIVPWTEEQKAAFVAQQFAAQDADYRRSYPSASFSVVEVGGIAAGRLVVDRRPGEIHLVDVSLFPEERGRGVGGRLVGELIEEARRDGKALSIHVERFNRALRLYARLGFRMLADLGVYYSLEWREEPDPASRPVPEPLAFPVPAGAP